MLAFFFRPRFSSVNNAENARVGKQPALQAAQNWYYKAACSFAWILKSYRPSLMRRFLFTDALRGRRRISAKPKSVLGEALQSRACAVVSLLSAEVPADAQMARSIRHDGRLL